MPLNRGHRTKKQLAAPTGTARRSDDKPTERLKNKSIRNPLSAKYLQKVDPGPLPLTPLLITTYDDLVKLVAKHGKQSAYA